MPKVFLDTDVILDLFIDRPPHHKEALRLFSVIKRKRIQAYTSPVVLANTYYMLAKIKDKKYANEKIKKLRTLIRIASVDENMIDQAIQAPHKDFEDSIQYYCAAANEIRFLITRNVEHFPKDKLNIVRPNEFTQVSNPIKT